MRKWLQKIKKVLLFLLPAIFFFALGCFAMYMILKDKVNVQGQLTGRILNNCITSLQASDQINKSCVGVYNTASSCISNFNKCNIKTENQKLMEYNTQRQEAEKILQHTIIETGNIMNDAKKVLQ